MLYRWDPPSADSRLGAARKGDVVDLTDEQADRIRRAWRTVDPLAACETTPAPLAPAVPLDAPPVESTPPAAGAPISEVACDPPDPTSEAAAWLPPVAAEDSSPATVTPPAPRKRGRRR